MVFMAITFGLRRYIVKKIFKWSGIVLGVLIFVILIVGVSLHFIGRSRLNVAPEVTTHPVIVPTDSAAIQRGEYLVNAVGQCRLCHGEHLEGSVLIDGEMGMYVPAPNLTGGKGGIGSAFSDADWERAIRHGVGGDDRVLAIMPSNSYSHFSNADLGALIAYLKQIPAVDNELGPRQIGFPGSVMGAVVGFDEFTHINGIDHGAVGNAPAPTEGVTVEYGGYLVSVAMCGECHAANLAGIYGDDGPPPGPNLTPAGDLANWSQDDFVATIRTGQTPEGRKLDPDMMPWNRYGTMSDSDLGAIYLYLSSQPAITNSQ
jgi:mono/diheme cytochrome c family protein